MGGSGEVSGLASIDAKNQKEFTCTETLDSAHEGLIAKTVEIHTGQQPDLVPYGMGNIAVGDPFLHGRQPGRRNVEGGCVEGFEKSKMPGFHPVLEHPASLPETTVSMSKIERIC